MSKLKHTPGPWNEEGIYVILRYADKHDMDIEESDTIMPWSRDDARLIAAAPEMLEALIYFSKRIKSGSAKNVKTKTYKKYIELIERVTGKKIEEVLS